MYIMFRFEYVGR